MSKANVSFEAQTNANGNKYTVQGSIYMDRIEISRNVHTDEVERHTTIYYKDVQKAVYERKNAACAWILFEMKASAKLIDDGIPYYNPNAIVFSGFGGVPLSKEIYADVNKWFGDYLKNPEAATNSKEQEEMQRRIFTGKSCWTVFANYSSEIRAYNDRVEVTRTGKVSDAPEKMVVYYSDMISFTCYKTFDYPGCWLSIGVAGGGSRGQSVGVVNVGRFAVGSASSNPWKDPYQVNFHYSHYSKLQKYCETVQELLGQYRKNKSTNEKAVQQSESSIDKLKKLKELHDLGILNDNEYEEKRQKLLSEI